MQPRQHQFGGGNAFFRMDVRRDSAPVIAHGDGAIPVQADLDLGRETGLRFVHRIVDDLEGHMVQAGAVIRIADIHSRPLADRIEPLENGNGGGVVDMGVGGGLRRRRGGIGHAENHSRMRGLDPIIAILGALA